MKTNKTFGWLLAAALLAVAMPVSAQDAPVVSGGGGGGGGGGGNSSGLALELQGRLPVLNTNGTGLLTGGGITLGDGFQPPAFMPLVTAGVRILDQRLFLGVGIGFYGTHQTDCTGGGGCADLTLRGFNLTPTVSYDVLVRGAARLYPVGMFNLGRVGTQVAEAGGTSVTTDGDFWWGLNLGVGIRGEINDTIGIGTEWGWGFARTSNGQGAGGDTNKLMAHGAFGTIFFSAKIGL